jgi:hypothetical protein
MQPSVIVWDLETVPDLAGFAAANDLAGKSDVELREGDRVEGSRSMLSHDLESNIQVRCYGPPMDGGGPKNISAGRLLV